MEVGFVTARIEKKYYPNNQLSNYQIIKYLTLGDA